MTSPADVSRTLARIAYQARGSTRETTEYFAKLDPAQTKTPRVIAERKEWAAESGDFDEARRLDELQPYFDDDGVPHASQALSAAAVYLASRDHAAARARLGKHPAELRSRLANEPQNWSVWRVLAQMEAILGNRDEALRCARKASELKPASADGLHGVDTAVQLAIVYAWVGDKTAAVDALGRLLRVPSSLNVHELKSGPWFASLRGDPRFEALLNDPKNNASLF